MEKDKLRSIAIPAIGTGNLHCPRPDVTKILFEEVTGYFTDHPQSLIGEVHFVAFGGDQATIDAFLGLLCYIFS
jgi:O-acetyl-ADP-ribose deacetylase (regulator of RNase III)